MPLDKRKVYISRIAAVWDILESEIKNAICEQVDYSVRFAETWDMSLLGRGGINMGEVLLERFSKLKEEHVENTKPKEPFDKHSVI